MKRNLASDRVDLTEDLAKLRKANIRMFEIAQSIIDTLPNWAPVPQLFLSEHNHNLIIRWERDQGSFTISILSDQSSFKFEWTNYNRNNLTEGSEYLRRELSDTVLDILQEFQDDIREDLTDLERVNAISLQYGMPTNDTLFLLAISGKIPEVGCMYRKDALIIAAREALAAKEAATKHKNS